MSMSLNEIDALCKRAARGSGLSWGLAEEAGKAARWLASHGLPGPEALAGVLTLNDGADYGALCPDVTADRWQAKGGQLSPLIAGAAICDLACAIAGGREIELGRTMYPILLLPFVAAAATLTGAQIAISWQGVSASFAPACRVNATDALSSEAIEHVHIARAKTSAGQPLIAAYRGDISPQAAATLGKLAHRTYAPDTPDSRLSGAGAGLSDND